MKEAVKLLNLMLTAVKTMQAVRKATGEEGYKFFLNLLGLQQKETIKPAVVKKVEVSAEPVVVLPAPVAQPQPVKPGTILSAPMLAKLALAPPPVNRSERMMQGTTPAPKLQRELPPPPNNLMAEKLGPVAVALGLIKTTIAQFREVLTDVNGRGKDYWVHCRELTAAVLEENSLMVADWELLFGIMKRNLFFNGRVGEIFIHLCPKDMLVNFVTSQEVAGMIDQIRNRDAANPASPYKLEFIIAMCAGAGKEADAVLENCKRAVVHMKDRKFIRPDHRLVRKVADMSHSHFPKEKFVPQEELVPEPTEASSAPSQEPEQAQVVPEPTAEDLTDEELQRRTRPSTQPDVTEITGGKPVNPSSAAEELYQRQMLAVAGELASIATAS